MAPLSSRERHGGFLRLVGVARIFAGHIFRNLYGNVADKC